MCNGISKEDYLEREECLRKKPLLLHYYITNREKLTSADLSNAIKNASTGSATGKVFIDGWTASLNGTLQNYKEDVKIVF